MRLCLPLNVEVEVENPLDVDVDKIMTGLVYAHHEVVEVTTCGLRKRVEALAIGRASTT